MVKSVWTQRLGEVKEDMECPYQKTTLHLMKLDIC